MIHFLIYNVSQFDVFNFVTLINLRNVTLVHCNEPYWKSIKLDLRSVIHIVIKPYIGIMVI